MRNILAHVPKGEKAIVAAALQTISAQPDRAAAGQQLTEVVAAMRARWAKAAVLLAEAEEDTLARKAFPPEHWTRIYSTNPLDRLNKEIKRRTYVVGVFPDEASVIRLVMDRTWWLTSTVKYLCWARRWLRNPGDMGRGRMGSNFEEDSPIRERPPGDRSQEDKIACFLFSLWRSPALRLPPRSRL